MAGGSLARLERLVVLGGELRAPNRTEIAASAA